MKQEKLWNKDFTLSTLAGFFPALIVYALLTTMTVYSTEKFGVGEGLAGFSSSVAMIGGILGRIFAGKYTDIVGRRRMMMALSLLNGVFCAMYFLPVGFVPMLIIRLLHGAVIGCAHNVMATAVIDFIPLTRRSEGIAIYTLNFTVATAIGPWLGMFIIDKWSYAALWGANIIFALAALFVLFPIRFAQTVYTKEQLAQLNNEKGASGIFEKSALPLSFMIAMLSLCYAGVTAFLETYTLEMDIEWIVEIFFVVFALSIIATRPFAGRLLDRRGENFVMVPTITIYSVSLAALGLSGLFPDFITRALPISLIFISAVLMAVGYGAALPMGQAITIKGVEGHRISKILSTYFIFSNGGMGVGALVFGFVASGVGIAGMYFVEAAVVLIALATYWQLYGRHNRGSRLRKQRAN